MVKNDPSSSQHWIKNIMLLALWISIVFIMLISTTALKINSDVSCGTERYFPETTDSYISSSVNLNTSTKAALQFTELDVNHLRYKICVGVNSSTAERISIVDSENNTLANIFIDNTSLVYCSSLVQTDLKPTNYIGVRCDSCLTNSVNVLKYTIGDEVSQIITNFGNETTTTTDEPFYFKIYAEKDCKDNLSFFTKLYISLLLVLVLTLLIIVGYDKFKAMLFEDW
jgi:hypothetical protein